ncbi:hypothetical protein [Nocardioides hwasunensis]|uniref:Uncharacterized protein n=1 Tax=Nocardioides hwasunensis TaxID=397258 RepID=A0ABR8MJF3_9ACTN|nr:hypothetical protein [Nocardioides hwasunensis]MBD3916175.1 hypothetical protein [Nocardioides hwasunensis]
MTAEQTSSAGPSGFVVRPDGTVAGDDGASGALAAALPYTWRLARRMGELVGAGDLRSMEAIGLRRLTVGVTWTPAGEGTYRAAVAPLEPRTVPSFLVVGAVDASAAVDHCLDRVLGVPGVRWSFVVTAGARVVAAAGDRQDLHHLAEVGNRMLAILRSLEDQHTTGFMRLRFEHGSVIGASLGRHALLASATTAADEDLLAIIDEVRAVLAGHDLSSVTTELDPEAVERAQDEVDLTHEVADPAPQPPLVGARFGGATRQERGKGDRTRTKGRARRSLFGR